MRAVLALLLLVPATAAADRPDAWMFRATPGFGYAWDQTPVCPVEGRMFVGGFSLGHTVMPGLLVGVAAGIGFNTLPTSACDVDGSGLTMTFGVTIGPSIDWYPSESGFHVSATGGYAQFDQDDMSSGRGVGGSVGVGFDWTSFQTKTGEDVRLGVLLQATGSRTTSAHTTVMPALLFTLGVD